MTELIQPYILFQYKLATDFNVLLNGIFSEATDVSIDNLYNFLNLDDAEGLWLDQIGLYLNYQRPLIQYSHAYNNGVLYNNGALYNGEILPADK